MNGCNPLHTLGCSGSMRSHGSAARWHALLCILFCLVAAAPTLAAPALSLTPAAGLEFGAQAVGTVSAPPAVTVTNSGDGFLIVSLNCSADGSQVFGGRDAGDFELGVPGPDDAALTCGGGLLLQHGE